MPREGSTQQVINEEGRRNPARPGVRWAAVSIGAAVLAAALAASLTCLHRHGRAVDAFLPMLFASLGCASVAIVAGLGALARSIRHGRHLTRATALVATVSGIVVTTSLWAAYFRGGTEPPAIAQTKVIEAPRVPNPLPGRTGLQLPLAAIPALPTARLTPDDVVRRFPAFHHAPFESGGFNALTLPFRYVDPDHAGNADEASAFAFLMSFALDWAPGSYCNRHAYFVFKRSRDKLKPFQTEYSHPAIASLLNDWGASHAVGGEIVRNATGGYHGTLEIYARNGRTTYRKAFDDPRPYFTLLGDMSADAMRFFGYDPTPALVEHLRRPRCAHASSIALLGSAAFMDERSDEEFGVYDRILKDDPDFGEVRFWWANQRGWKEPLWRDGPRNKGLALRSYLQPVALREFSFSPCDDPALNAMLPQWMEQSHALVGEDHPDYLYYRLKCLSAQKQYDIALLDRGLHLAERFPNAFDLIRRLGWDYGDSDGLKDADLAASLAYAARSCFFSPGDGDTASALSDFALNTERLGDDALTLQALASAPLARSARVTLAHALFNAGRYGELLRRYDQWDATGLADGIDAQAQIATYAAVAAVFLGRFDRVHAIRKAHPAAVAYGNMTELLDDYEDLAAGKTTDVGLNIRATVAMDWCFWQWGLLLAQVDLLNGKELFRHQFDNLLFQVPNERLGWVLEDLYAQRHAPSMRDMYDALAWLHPDDPWLQATLKRRRQQLPATTGPSPDAAEAEQVLQNAPAERWLTRDKGLALAPRRSDWPNPFAVTVTVHALLDADQRERAHDLACRFRSVMMGYPPTAVVFANHLIHLTEASPE